jgi:hypothetical protein
MAAHRYWRIAIWETIPGPDGQLAFINELEMYDSGGSSLISGGTASASSQGGFGGAPGVFLPSYAFDSNFGTAWWASVVPTQDAPQWLQYTFATPVDVASIRMSVGSAGITAYSPTQFIIQYSDDGLAWVPASALFVGVLWRQIPSGRAFGSQFVWTFATAPPAAGYYGNWRILVHDTQDHGASGGPALSDLAWRAVAGEPKITTEIPQYAFWSDQRAGAYDGSNAYDSDANSDWLSDALVGNWLGYNFPSPVFIAEIAITASNSTLTGAGGALRYERAPTVFDVQGSNDGGITWGTIASITTQPWTEIGQSQTFTVQTSGSGLLFFARGNIDYDQAKVKARTGPGPEFAMYAFRGRPLPGSAFFDGDGNLQSTGGNAAPDGTTTGGGGGGGTGGGGTGGTTTSTHTELLSDSGGPITTASGDYIYVTGVPD